MWKPRPKGLSSSSLSKRSRYGSAMGSYDRRVALLFESFSASCSGVMPTLSALGGLSAQVPVEPTV